MTTATDPAPLRGLAAGAAAGLAASLAMDGFQKIWAKFLPMPPSDGDPATVKAAERVSRAATGEGLPEPDKSLAGQVVHYLFGAGLGAAYGVLAEYRPGVTRGFGALFGAGSGLLFDEIAVPAAGLGTPPDEAPPRSHAYSLASHLVYGGVSEGVRRVLRRN